MLVECKPQKRGEALAHIVFGMKCTPPNQSCSSPFSPPSPTIQALSLRMNLSSL